MKKGDRIYGIELRVERRYKDTREGQHMDSPTREEMKFDGVYLDLRTDFVEVSIVKKEEIYFKGRGGMVFDGRKSIKRNELNRVIGRKVWCEGDLTKSKYEELVRKLYEDRIQEKVFLDMEMLELKNLLSEFKSKEDGD